MLLIFPSHELGQDSFNFEVDPLWDVYFSYYKMKMLTIKTKN